MEEQEPAPLPIKPKKEKSQLKTIAFWAGLFRNFFTIIASIVSVATLYILIRQNENTYRPDLELTAAVPVFEIRYQDIPAKCSDIGFYKTDSTLAAVSLNVVNLGMGAAKDVALEWTFDTTIMRDSVVLATVKLNTGIVYNRNLNMYVLGNCMFGQHAVDQVDYILPVNQERQPTGIDLPYNLLISWSNLMARAAYANADKDQCIEMLRYFCRQFGDLKLAVTYSDINKKQIRKQFQLRLAPNYFDLEARKIICTVTTSETGYPENPGNRPGFVILFPDHTLRKVEIR